MKLNKLLKDIPYSLIQGDEAVNIDGIVYDSRKAIPNSLFVCLKGIKTPNDGHEYARQAIANGATALLVEHDITNLQGKVAVVRVDNTRKILPKIANIFYGEPSKSINLIGITGTNGKTSISIYIGKILETAGRKVGVIGTIGSFINSKPLDFQKTTPTTPESVDLQFLLKQMKDKNVRTVVMETTSMGLEHHRVDDCDFDVGVFTNLTQDHLDDHKTMENYQAAKLKLFKMCKCAVINGDDPVAQAIINLRAGKILTYGIYHKADLMATNIHTSLEGVTFTLSFQEITKQVQLRIPGQFSVYNALASIGACYCLGLTLDQIIDGLGQITGVPGRFEVITSPKGFQVIIDYAHTPDAIENILNTVKGFGTGRIITVFGCGGDRDRTKRPIMGEIVGKHSDLSIITTDNSRTENPFQILEEIEIGMKKTVCSYEKIENRLTAILFALDRALPGDVVVIAGKGHETYQELKDKVIHFSDLEVVNEYFERS